MFGLLIRKTFYDIWDNLSAVAALNLGAYLLAAALALAYSALPSVPAVSLASALLFVFGFGWYIGAAALALKNIADYGAFRFKHFAACFSKALPAGAGFTVFAGLFILFSRLILPFYYNLKGFLGLFLSAVVFWMLAGICLAAQFFLAVFARHEGRFFAKVKHGLLFALDNTFFAAAVLVCGLVMLVISLPFLFFWPGMAGIVLFWDEAYRLRMLKYRWMERQQEGAAGNLRETSGGISAETSAENSGEKFGKTFGRKLKIPWNEILAEEREATGKRSFRQLIFPWKSV